MRTVDPEIWYKKLRKPPLKVTRPVPSGNKHVKDLEIRIRASFRDAMNEFRKNSSVVKVKCFSHEYSQKTHKIYQRILLLITLSFGFFVFTYNLYQYQTTPPLLINMQSSQHSIQYIHFPAVGLCSNNVISKRALHEYTKFLYSKDNNHTYPKEVIERNLLNFGALLTLTLPPVDVMFMRFLMNADPHFNVTYLMLKLSPQCSSLLERCSWRGRLIPCGRLFAPRVTPLGFCCMFNSRYQPEDINTPPKILELVGHDHGLSVVIRENSDDFAYLRRHSNGFEVLIFEGTEYPLIEGGAVRMYPVEHNASVYVSLSARAQYPAEGLRYYSESLRGCRLRRGGARSWRSSYSWCLAQCRRRALAALCSCRSFTHQPLGAARHPLCALNDIACLNKHREKLIYYHPGVDTDPALDEELENSQYCPECVPDCYRIVYTASIAHSRYEKKGKKIFQNMFSKGLSLTNATVIRLFYATEDHELYAVEANLRWYETFASLNCQLAVVGGISIISASELLFYCTIRWGHHFIRRTRMTQKFNKE